MGRNKQSLGFMRTSGRVFSEGAQRLLKAMDLLDKAEEEAITFAAAVPTKSPLSRISQVD